MALVNRHAKAMPVQIDVSGLSGPMMFLKYVYNPEQVPHTTYGELQPPTAEMKVEDASWTGTVPPRSLVVYTTTYDTEAPPAVAGIEVQKAQDGARRITWKPVRADDLCYYRIYRVPAGGDAPHGRVKIGTTVATSFVDSNPPPGEYSYDVVAVDRAGNPRR